MSPKKTKRAGGLIPFHTPFPLSLLKSQESTLELKDSTENTKSSSQPRSQVKCGRASKASVQSPSEPQPGTRRDLPSHSSHRRLQKKEAENQKAKAINHPSVDTENCFMKELEKYLSQHDVAELRRRELLHKRWTERVWFPLQKRVEERVSRCGPEEVKRRQSLYSHYLHHCNTKGFVFLETFNPKEYNPFLLTFKKPHYIKLSSADFKDPLYRQLHERVKDERTARTCAAGCKKKLPQSNRPLSESALSQADIFLRTPTHSPAAITRKTPAEGESQGRKSGRLDTIPYHISASLTPDGRCHQPNCYFSRCGYRKQSASLQQLQSTSK